MGQLTQPQLDINLDIHHPMSLHTHLQRMKKIYKLGSCSSVVVPNLG